MKNKKQISQKSNYYSDLVNFDWLKNYQSPRVDFNPVQSVSSTAGYRRIHEFNDFIEKEGFKQVLRKHYDALKLYLRSNLENIGFSFTDEFEFLKLIEDRVTRIGVTENRYHFEYYLDYVSEENRGIYIGSSSSKVTTDFYKGKITFTIG